MTSQIGSINFLKHLPGLLDTGANSGNLPQVLTGMHGPGLEKEGQMGSDGVRTLTSKLLQRMPINVNKDCIDRKLWESEKRKIEHDLEAISKTLGVMLLDVASAAYLGTQNSKEMGMRLRDHNHLHSKPVFQAQEEDIVGKILWTCLCGIHLEIGEVLENVVHCVLNDSLVPAKVLGMRAELLQEMGNMFKNALLKFQGDDQPYLWQVVCNAKLGISKHHLYNDEQPDHESLGCNVRK
ncbi:hypothetical protein EDD15DRAFT_1312802 [Pisolithus albus]|nr:hypothetical protein EDD15DRAFT_1312802 [Pisolithus albus]